MIFPLSNPQDNPLQFSAFIFVHDNLANIYDLGSVTTWINTGDSGDMVEDANTTIYFPSGFKAAVLLCDSQYTTQRAEVTLQDEQLNATLAEAPHLLGNFPDSAANSLFSQAFLNAFAPVLGDFIGAVVANTFTTSHGDGNLTLLSLPEINQNMNKAVQSAAKAYISGYTGFGGSQLGVVPSYTSFNQTAAVQDQQISLVSSPPFVVGLWVLYAFMVLLLAALLLASNLRETQLFDLQTMETIYRGMSIPALSG